MSNAPQQNAAWIAHSFINVHSLVACLSRTHDADALTRSSNKGFKIQLEKSCEESAADILLGAWRISSTKTMCAFEAKHATPRRAIIDQLSDPNVSCCPDACVPAASARDQPVGSYRPLSHIPSDSPSLSSLVDSGRWKKVTLQPSRTE